MPVHPPTNVVPFLPDNPPAVPHGLARTLAAWSADYLARRRSGNVPIDSLVRYFAFRHPYLRAPLASLLGRESSHVSRIVETMIRAAAHGPVAAGSPAPLPPLGPSDPVPDELAAVLAHWSIGMAAWFSGRRSETFVDDQFEFVQAHDPDSLPSYIDAIAAALGADLVVSLAGKLGRVFTEAAGATELASLAADEPAPAGGG